jgi:hypothetical protein
VSFGSRRRPAIRLQVAVQPAGKKTTINTAQGTMKKLRVVLMLGSFGLLAGGCVSQTLKFPTTEQVNKAHYQVLGEGKGEATGLMLFQFIPIGQNQRYVRAYDAAVKSKGGDALIDPVIEENWFWAYILNGYQTRVSGTVIKFTQ